MAHPRHQILESRPAASREVVTRVSQVVEVQALHTDCPYGMRPAGHLVEVTAAQRTAHLAWEDQRTRLILDEGAFSSPAPRTRHGLRARILSSSAAVIRTARRNRYALAAVEIETPLLSKVARHCRIIGVDSLPTGTPPRYGPTCFLSSHR
jgi:hypothetical protein